MEHLSRRLNKAVEITCGKEQGELKKRLAPYGTVIEAWYEMVKLFCNTYKEKF